MPSAVRNMTDPATKNRGRREKTAAGPSKHGAAHSQDEERNTGTDSAAGGPSLCGQTTNQRTGMEGRAVPPLRLPYAEQDLWSVSVSFFHRAMEEIGREAVALPCLIHRIRRRVAHWMEGTR
jgi:hypothetical protein